MDLINPNDNEIKQKIIKCYEIIYENNSEIKLKLLSIVDLYCNKHENLNINKNDLFDYLNQIISLTLLKNLNEKYILSTSNCSGAKYEYNKIMLNLMINTSYNKELYKDAYNFINLIINQYFNNLVNDEISTYYKHIFIYYNIYNLFKLNDDNKSKTTNLNISIKYIHDKIIKLKKDNEFLNKSIKDLKDKNEFLNKSIEDIKDDNRNNLIILNKSIKDLKDNNKILNIKLNILLLITTTLFIIKNYIYYF